MTVDAAVRSPHIQTTVPATAGAALAAYVLVSIGSSLRGDILLLLGVPLTVAGFAAACVAARRRVAPAVPWSIAGATLSLSALAAVGLAAPGMDDSRLWFTLAIRTYFALAIVLAGVFAAAGPLGRRRVTGVLVAGAILLQFAAPFGVHADVDLWSWTQSAALALLHGIQPYTIHAPDLQRGGFDFGSTPTVYPYMPLTILAAAPWVAWLGDYRVGLACCLPATIVLLRRAGRALALDAAWIDLITLAFVLHPLGTAMTATGYLEPVMVLMAAAFVLFAITAPRGIAEATAFLLLPAIKQYVMAPVLLYVVMRGRARSVAAGAAVAAATVLPFLLWRWRPTIDGIFFFVRTPLGFRADSDSMAALLFALTGLETPRVVAILVQLLAAAVAYRGLRDRGLEGLLLASALSLLASFLVASQAFTNYYDFAGALLLLSALVAAKGSASA